MTTVTRLGCLPALGRNPTFLLLAAALVWSVNPLIIAATGAASSPFIYFACWRAGSGAGVLVFLLTVYTQSRTRAFWRSVAAGVRTRAFWRIVVGHSDLFLFSLGTGFLVRVLLTSP